MTECIVTIKNGCIYIPKKFIEKAGFKQNERVILRVTEHGMAFTKIGCIDEIELFFSELDVELQKLFIKDKNKQFNKKQG